MSSQYVEENLIYMGLAGNRCYTQVTRERPEGVTVNLITGTWTWRGAERAIGEGRTSAQYEGGSIIGVYDRTNDEHLSHMLFHSREATQVD